ncbi:MAG: 3,4-dihydroxy-2-butanone-4-phosphate synthase [Candidatus Pelagibacterales bacterium]|jgi:3,4-dihydroxy 2-butanone 4-phosphate synthase/GTP cyclohydrolase II|tara:strand:- start:1535 stop:2665 length:1131 start_codon:yes stop_codon:yes gene_type:complete
MVDNITSSIEEIIEDLKNGKMVIMVDDEDRENEGDLIIPAAKADADAVNFMATHGRGLICLTLTADRVKKLNLPLMAQNNQHRDATAFTISIESVEGVTTGISAQDRATTIASAIDPSKGQNDITSPGHVFPLVARDGGVLVRAGHTEASVDLARLAGFEPAGTICEIMNDDGTMARIPDLVSFSKKHNIKIGKIVDLITYRRRNDTFINKALDEKIVLKDGKEFDVKVFDNSFDQTEQIVLSKGNIGDGKPVIVRVHVISYFDDLIGEYGSGNESLKQTIDIINKEQRGILILVRDSGTSVINNYLSSKSSISKSVKDIENDKQSELRVFGMGAQILYELGVKEMILLTNTDWKFVGLDAYGINIIETKFLKDLA